jgi:putative methionine-R-sulfoxide reductase with GAF domain/anti-sigma regulatory factor (Ser/Thr protein kinase)
MNNQFYDSLKNNLLLKNTDITSLNLDEVKGRLIRVGEGEIVYREGAQSDLIYLVVSGQINIIKRKILGKAKSYIYVANEFFGNDEYFDETTRTATAVALQDSYLIILSREEIENLVLQDNEIFLALRENLSELFDNSTEINVEEHTEVEEEPVSEIEKIITGAEIEKEFLEETPVEIISSNNKTEVLPEFQIPYEHAVIEDIPPTEEIIGEPAALEDFVNEDTPSTEQEYSIQTSPPEIPESDSSIMDFSVIEGPVPSANEDEIIARSISSYNESIPEISEEHFDETTGFEQTSAEEPTLEEFQPYNGEIEPVQEEISAPETEEIKETITNKFETEIDSSEPETGAKEEKNIYALSDDKAGGEMNTEEVNKLIRAMELVNSTVKIDDLLTSIVNVATDLTSADRGTLYLVDNEKGELWSKIALGTEPKEIRLKIGEGIAGNVARTKIIENIKDVTQHPMFKKDVDKSSGYVTKNMLCFPLKNKNEEVIGVLQLLNSKNGEFSQHDEELLSMISINTAIALQNADLVGKLLQAERVSSLGKMTNFLIQDIKKPVLVSKRYTEHLKSKNLAPELTQLVDMILTELTQVADLVQTTSSYAEGKTILRTSVTGINAALQDYIGRMEQFVLSRHCKINFDPDKDVNVKLDSKEFFQCFQHIVKNACDAMPDGGTLSIKTKIADKKIKIIFEDQGLGIPESFIDKIFEPFMTHGKKEGAGLGLSITKKVVEAHQGTIEVKSSLGAGAAFTVTLPTGS